MKLRVPPKCVCSVRAVDMCTSTLLLATNEKSLAEIIIRSHFDTFFQRRTRVSTASGLLQEMQAPEMRAAWLTPDLPLDFSVDPHRGGGAIRPLQEFLFPHRFLHDDHPFLCTISPRKFSQANAPSPYSPVKGFRTSERRICQRTSMLPVSPGCRAPAICSIPSMSVAMRSGLFLRESIYRSM